jgi:hypothetical protein
MSERIHFLVDRSEKERFRSAAARQGLSLSDWLKAAAHEKLAKAEQNALLDTRAAMEAFFAGCDRVEQGREPDWEVQRLSIEQSRTSGLPST